MNNPLTVDTLQLKVHKLQIKIDSLQIGTHKINSDIDSLHKSLDKFDITSTYFHDIINTEVTTFVGLVGVIITLIALGSWVTFVLPLRKQIRSLKTDILRLRTNLISIIDEKEVELRKKIEEQEKAIQFINSNLGISNVTINITSTTGEDARMLGNLEGKSSAGEEWSQQVGLPNTITLPYGKYKIWPAREGYTMAQDNMKFFEVKDVFTNVDIMVIKSVL